MDNHEIVSLGWCYISRHSNIPKLFKDINLRPLQECPPIKECLAIAWRSQSFCGIECKELLDIDIYNWTQSLFWESNANLLRSLWFNAQRYLISPINYVTFVDIRRDMLDLQIELLIYEPQDTNLFRKVWG